MRNIHGIIIEKETAKTENTIQVKNLELLKLGTLDQSYAQCTIIVWPHMCYGEDPQDFRMVGS